MFARISLKKSIPLDIRNHQVGDWGYDEGSIWSAASYEMSEDSRFAITIHELVEAYLCRKAGIRDEEVCQWDEKYENDRTEDESEPGDHKHAPYREQHQAATHVERAVCHALGLNWKEHSQSVTGSAEDHPKT